MFDKINTVDGALELLRSAVKERGEDYIYMNEYPTCSYAVLDRGELEPACIVGVAIYTEDGPAGLERAHTFEGRNVKELPFMTDKAAREVLLVAQEQQDHGHSWGQALEAAENRAALLAVETS